MTGALEKAARALCVLDGHDPDGPVCDIYIHDDPHAGKPWASYRRQARAVLMAVKAQAAPYSDESMFNIMIDRILTEETK